MFDGRQFDTSFIYYSTAHGYEHKHASLILFLVTRYIWMKKKGKRVTSIQWTIWNLQYDTHVWNNFINGILFHIALRYFALFKQKVVFMRSDLFLFLWLPKPILNHWKALLFCTTAIKLFSAIVVCLFFRKTLK